MEHGQWTEPMWGIVRSDVYPRYLALMKEGMLPGQAAPVAFDSEQNNGERQEKLPQGATPTGRYLARRVPILIAHKRSQTASLTASMAQQIRK